MSINQSNNPNNGWDKDNKIKQLKKYLTESPYIELVDRPSICAKFDLPNVASPFREVYDARFVDYLRNHTTTIATVSKELNIPHKYLCQLKKRFEEQGILKVVGFGRCPTTTTKDVQFVACKHLSHNTVCHWEFNCS